MSPATDRYSQIVEAKFFDPDASNAELARRFGCGRTTVKRALEWCKTQETALAPKAKEELKTDYGSKTGEITSVSPKIKTAEEAMIAAGVDEELWEVERQVVNHWDMTNSEGETYTNYQIKVFLKRRASDFHKIGLERLLVDIERESPREAYVQGDPLEDPHMLEIALYDVHFGKLAWAAETGTDFDLKIAEEMFKRAVVDLLEKSENFCIDKVLFPIGQDFFHINNMENTTAKGTPQDVDGRLAKVFEVGCNAVKWAIEECKLTADVEVLWVPGNHDPETSYYLCKYLEAYFHNDPNVEVDCSPMSRKYRLYGAALLGFVHGADGKAQDLPLIMAGEVPQLWAKSKHREIHTGHIHKAKETRYTAGDTFNPVIVRIIPSMTGTDAWHYKNGFVKDDATRSAEAYLWSKTRGYVGHFSTNNI